MPDSPCSLADTWRLNNRVNLVLLEPLTVEQLAHVPSPRARNIAGQFAHLHHARLMWLEVRSADAVKGLGKIEKAAPRRGLRGGRWELHPKHSRGCARRQNARGR